jgi:hypothetical protein
MPFEYDAELMESARGIVEHRLDKPRDREIERQLELPFPELPHEPAKREQ